MAIPCPIPCAKLYDLVTHLYSLTLFCTLSTDRRLRIALVGCGRISRNHIKVLAAQHHRASIVAVCDTQIDSLKHIQSFMDDCTRDIPIQAWDVQLFTSYNDLIDSVVSNQLDVDLVVLTTPSGLHSSQAIQAANAGIHVCTEKPMATSWEDGLLMSRACDKAGVKLFVVLQNRFLNTIQLLKRQLDLGRFGPISLISSNVFWQRPQSYYDNDSWRGTLDLDGGALMNQASHYIDLLQWLFGPVASVSASLATLGRNIEVEDTATLQLRWNNGALGTMAVTMLTYPHNLEGSITVLGQNGSVKISGKALNSIEYWHFLDDVSDDQTAKSFLPATVDIQSSPLFLFYSNIFDSLAGFSEPLCDAAQGLLSLELLSASYLSAHKESAIPLPLDRST